MSVTQADLSESRPPPKPQQRIVLTTPGIPWYRDLRILRIIAQVVFVIGFVGGLYILFSNLVRNLDESSLTLNFNVFTRPFTVAVSEGISITEEWSWINNVDTLQVIVGLIWVIALAFVVRRAFLLYRRTGEIRPWPVTLAIGLVLLAIFYPFPAMAEDLANTLADYFKGSSITRAFITGILNTLRVVVLSLIACTLLGIFVGIGLLSRNFLVRTVAQVYVEIFRNTPLLVQLFFIDRTLTLLMPRPRQSIMSPSNIFGFELDNSFYILNTRGIFIAEPVPQDGANLFYLAAIIALAVGWFIRRRRLALQEETGEPANTWRIALPVMLVIIVVGWIAAGSPFTIEYPSLEGIRVLGGSSISLGFVSLFLGLTLYTAAFIADIVRAGIQSVPHGQLEAARSQGLRGSQVLNLVVLPQALRLIIPPLGNQYVNLGKNSSLGLVVGYFDTYQIALLANNETGQAVPFFVGLMVIYLSLSLTLSVMTNFINRVTELRSR